MDVKEENILGASVYSHWYYKSKYKAIEKLLRDISADSVLDVGAGSGVFSKLLLDANIIKSARCVDTAYDADFESESYSGKTIQFVKSAEDINEPLLLMIDVLEHVDDDLALLKYYVERMPIGGHILISVPAFDFLWSGHDVFLEHKRRYTLAQIESLAKRAGLHVEQGRYFFGLLFPLMALIRLINRINLKSGKLSAKSDLKKTNFVLNKLLIVIHSLELITLFSFNRGAGLTIFCLARKGAPLSSQCKFE